jgi:hypothetical protein
LIDNITGMGMDIPETYFKIIFKIVKKQNEYLLREICLHELQNGKRGSDGSNLKFSELKQKYLPRMRDLKEFLHVPPK